MNTKYTVMEEKECPVCKGKNRLKLRKLYKHRCVACGGTGIKFIKVDLEEALCYIFAKRFRK